MRLQLLSDRQRERLATESATEREARLQRRRDSLATESTEQREARLQNYSDRHRELGAVQSSLPLFHQQSIRRKMLHFHTHMESLHRMHHLL